MLNAKNVPSTGGGFSIEPLEEGAYPARLVSVVTLGIQPQRPYQGQEKPPALEISLTYELLDEFMKDEDGNEDEEKPRWISETMAFHNLESERANSTKRYFALDPKMEADGDWSELIGTPCNVVLNQYTVKSGKNAGKVRNGVDTITGMTSKQASKAAELVNKPFVFDFYEPTQETWERLPEWIQDTMKKAVDFKGSALEDFLDSLPEGEEGEKESKSNKVGKSKSSGDEEELGY